MGSRTLHGSSEEWQGNRMIVSNPHSKHAHHARIPWMGLPVDAEGKIEAKANESDVADIRQIASQASDAASRIQVRFCKREPYLCLKAQSC